MEANSYWYDRIANEISPYQNILSKKDYKKYKLDLLLRVARRVDGFSSSCGECLIFQQEITQLVQELGNLVQIPNKEGLKNHIKAINSIVKHLQKQHKLVSEGQYIGIGLAIGAGIGTALGAALDNTGVGIAIGTGIGLAVGSYLDRKAKEEGKII